MKYDYRKEMYGDIEEYIEREFGVAILREMYKEDAYEKLFDELWAYDGVTGNASGSYTFNAYQAEEYICHNMDLAVEAYVEFGYDSIPANEVFNAERIDVTIRCYLLGEVLNEVLDDIYDDIEDMEDEEDD